MQQAKKRDNVCMKKNVFLLFLIFLLIFIQFLSTNKNRILTFHSKIEREIITHISKTCWILDGNPDLNIGSSPYAIYKVVVARNENFYIVLAREKQTGRDLVILINPKEIMEVNRLDISPYQFQRNNNTDFRGLLDIDNDRNIELVCVVNGKSGKRIKIFKILQKNLLEIPLKMVENSINIRLNDFDLNGQPDIACYASENGIMTPPQIFRMQGKSILKEKLQFFPTLVQEYETYINNVEKRTRTGSNPAIAYDLMIAKARIYVSMQDEESFNKIKILLEANLISMDVVKRIREYQLTILESYFSFQKGEENKAFQKIYEAIDGMYKESISKKQRESIFYTELAIYDLFQNNWTSANKNINLALILDPDNVRARQNNIWMGNE